MEVLILSKTQFGKNACVGGIVLQNKQYIRLLNPGGWYQYADTEFSIGQIWDIVFKPSSPIIEPHNEDVVIVSKRYLRTVDSIIKFVNDNRLTVWKGPINNIFQGKIRWASSGAGFLSADYPDYPDHSIGFWLSDKPLRYKNDHYYYNNFVLRPLRKLKYKGFPEPVAMIPANTLLRVSLAKWWKPDDSDDEERCYLQLSGWYDL